MNRRHHLEQTIHHNLAAVESFSNVDLVLLDYGSSDYLQEYVKNNLQLSINCGRLHYYRLDGVTVFRHAHAKNVAHRLATGTVLCNLDADNFLSAKYVDWLTLIFSQTTSIIAVPNGNRGGTFGRIALGKSDFIALRGYNELLSHGWGYEDNDLVNAARTQHLRIVIADHDKLEINAIQHTDKDRFINCFISSRVRSLEYHRYVSHSMCWHKAVEQYYLFGNAIVRTIDGSIVSTGSA